MRTIGRSFRQLLEAALSVRPFQTDQGVVTVETREIVFGSPAGAHESARCWIYKPHGAPVEMVFGFYANFTPHDLITKVVTPNVEIGPGIGASIQFNSDECITFEEGHFSLHHHGRVTVGHGRSRAALVTCINEQAPDADRMLGGLNPAHGWPLNLGNTSHLGDLIDRLFLYSYAVEEAKRTWRGENLLPPLGPASADATPTPRQGPRWRISAETRALIEAVAMEKALQHYRQLWPRVEDVSASQSYDIHCAGGSRELRVEVKGTSLDGSVVQLTPNELAHARTHWPRVALFVVHGIELDQDLATGRLTADGGEITVYEPWNVDECELVPTGYSCFLPPSSIADPRTES